MRIIINRQPEEWDSCFCDEEVEHYFLNAALSTDADADDNYSFTSTDVMKMVLKACMIEGYHINSILQSMFDVATYEAYQRGIKLDATEACLDEITFAIKKDE